MPHTPAEITAAVAAERARCIELMSLCPESKIGASALNAVKNGTTAESFAIGIVHRSNGNAEAADGAEAATRALNLAAQAGSPHAPRTA